MRILLHGAINYNNFGDYLFSELFYHAVLHNGDEAEFFAHPRYGISSFFVKHLHYPLKDRKVLKQLRHCDALVYIPGGYFMDSRKKQLIPRFRHLLRYMLPAVWFLLARKPIYVLGVGAGPFSKSLFSRLAVRVMNTAKVVHVRNEESKRYCLESGVVNPITVTADTALLIQEHLEKTGRTLESVDIPAGRKALFLHIDGSSAVNRLIFSEIVPAVEQFLSQHPQYDLYLGADSVIDDTNYTSFAERLSAWNPCILRYDDPWKLCAWLKRMDLVITTKLHVGIVSCSFERSVLSFPYVPQKTQRFYRQIGESCRCIPLADVRRDQVLELMEQKESHPIIIPEDLLRQARKNLEAIPHS